MHRYAGNPDSPRNMHALVHYLNVEANNYFVHNMSLGSNPWSVTSEERPNAAQMYMSV